MAREVRGTRFGRAAAICTVVVAVLTLAPAQAGAAPGDLDRSFGRSGVIDLTPPPSPDGRGVVPVDLAVGPADEIFLASEGLFSCDVDGSDFCSRAYISKLSPKGAPDTSFGAPAAGVAELPGSDVEEIVVDWAGRPLLVMGGDGPTVLVRLLANGTPDPSFGGDGTVSIDAAMEVADVALAPDGSIALGGSVRQPNRSRLNLAFVRLRSDGSLDSGFGVNGVVGINLSHVDHAGELAFVGGELVATAAASGECCGELTVFRLLRLSASGQLLRLSDPWRGGRRGAKWTADPDALLMAPGGKLRLFGHERDGTPMAGLRAGRSIDRGFGTRGFAFAPGFFLGATDATARDRAGRAVLGGATPTVDRFENENEALAVTRRRPDGRLDRTFGGGRPQPVNSSANETVRVRGMDVQSDGGIVLFGLSYWQCVRVCPDRVTTYTLARFLGGASRARCHGRRATVVGTRRSERIVGTPHRDVIVGLGGADRIDGRGGADLICGNKGADVLVGGKGNDLLLGGSGFDRLRRGPGRDRARQ